ncbi:MAG: M20/M25/M40 family metallo-hydrolase [Lachnospiraceae bacterium]|nr:M20/M25/M40 family metallo-hydrolase [Lachnospiraceae bacterium]
MKKPLSLLLLLSLTLLFVTSCGDVMPQNAQVVDASVEVSASSGQESASADDDTVSGDADASGGGTAADEGASASEADSAKESSFDADLRFALEQGDAVAEDSYALMCEIAAEFPDRDARRIGNDHAACRDWLAWQLRELAPTAEFTEQPFVSKDVAANENADMVNLMLTLPGVDTSKQIIIGAHYDGTGIGDNASGVALSLALIRALSGRTPDVTLRFLFFDDEEYGEYGSYAYTEAMTKEERDATLFYINIDSVAFGDYCHLYGGVSSQADGSVTQTEAYDLAMQRAKALGFSVYDTAYLDGYFERTGAAPPTDDMGFFTNPWTREHPMPSVDTVYEDLAVFSPATVPYSDHHPFAELGIPYLYLEATNWFAKGTNPKLAYTGYYETADATLGEGGMFMNTEYDTEEVLEQLFPGRAQAHFKLYAPLLLSLLLQPEHGGEVKK